MPSQILLTEEAAASIPTPSSGKSALFLDSADSTPKYRDDGGTLHSLVGNQGDPGQGVPTGGTAGQYLRKQSGTDYDTAFADIQSSEVSDFDEAAQDAVGAMIATTSTIALTYTDATPELKADIVSSAPLPGSPTTTTQSSGDNSTKVATTAFVTDAVAKQPEVLIIACSDETTDITTGTAKVTFRMPFALTLTAVRASVTTAPTGSTIIIDINEEGTTVLSTKLSIDASEKTSTTAASAAVISDSALADDAEITIDFDQVGSTIAGAGVKVYLIGTRA